MWHTQPPLPLPRTQKTTTRSASLSVPTLARLIARAQKGQQQSYSPLDDVRVLNEYAQTFVGKQPPRNIFECMAELMLADPVTLKEFLGEEEEEEEDPQDDVLPQFSPLDFDPKNRYGLLEDKETWACCGEKLGDSDGCWIRMDERDPEGVVLPYRLWTDAKEKPRGKQTKAQLEKWILQEIRPGSAFQRKKYYTRLHEEIKGRVERLAFDVAAYYLGEVDEFTRKEELRDLFRLYYEYNQIQNKQLLQRDVYELDRIKFAENVLAVIRPPARKPKVVKPVPFVPNPKVVEPSPPKPVPKSKVVEPSPPPLAPEQQVVTYMVVNPVAKDIAEFVEKTNELAIGSNFDLTKRENQILFRFANAIVLSKSEYSRRMLYLKLKFLYNQYVTNKKNEVDDIADVITKEKNNLIYNNKAEKFSNQFAKPNVAPPNLQQWRPASSRISASNTIYNNNSCPFDSMLTALFKRPGTWLINEIREARNGFAAYKGTEEQTVLLHSALLSDIEKLQADTNERWENITRPAWINVLPVGNANTIQDDPRALMSSLFQFYKLQDNNVLTILRNINALIDVPAIIPDAVQIIIVEFDVTTAPLGTKINNVSDEIGEFELVSCLSWKGILHWVSYVKDNDGTWYYFDALTNKNRELQPGRTHLEQGKEGIEQPCGWIYFRKQQ